MPVATTNAINGPLYGNGSATEFPYTFTAQLTSDVAVLLDGEVYSAALYSVLLDEDGGGTVTFDTAPVTDAEIFIYLDPEFTQETEFIDGIEWKANPVNRAYDRGALRDQVLRRDIDRATLVPMGENGTILPPVADRAGMFFAWDAEGDAVPSVGLGSDADLRTDLAAGGDALNAFVQSGTGSATQSVRSKLRNSSTHLMDKIPTTEWAAIEAGTTTYDASTALANALDRGKRVILPVGTVLANFSDFASGMEIEGECREGSVIRPYDVDGHMLLADSGGAATFIEDLRFSNFTAYGHVEAEAFLEQCHLFFLNGVKGALLDGLTVKGFRGDGICLGSGLNTPGTTERHNATCSSSTG